MIDNGLNELGCSLSLKPDVAGDEVEIGGHLDPGADGTKDEAWQAPSPLAILPAKTPDLVKDST
ncbi:MAG: hypothetical protein WDM91_10810 [Rhizomicrobium sp.]